MPQTAGDGNLPSPSVYYNQMRQLAREKREAYGVETEKLNLLVIRRIYRAEGITIDKRNLRGNKIRAAYFCEDDDPSVLLSARLPREPALFALVHELKHHYVDRHLINSGVIRCGDYNSNELIEKAAEVFAAEFIYPEAEMRLLASRMGISKQTCTPKSVVAFKRTCPACVSYKFIVKRFERFGFCEKGAFAKVKFQKLEESIHGLPLYKQPWFRERQSRKRKTP